MKFEERNEGATAKLIVKNITTNDFAEFTAEARGEKCKAKLSKAKLSEQKPFYGKMDSVAGLAGDIEVFMIQVQPGTHVSWYKGNKKITNQTFR